MSRHRDIRKLNINDELDDDALSDGGEEPMTEEQENELYDALESVRAIIGNAQASGISDSELKECLWQEYNDVNRTIEWALAEQGRKRVALERKDSALEYFRSRNLDPSDDQSRVPKIILAQQQAFEQDETNDTYAPEDHPNPPLEDLDSTYFVPYRTELSTITERSEIATEPSFRALQLLERRGGGDSSQTTSYGEILEDDSRTQRFFANVMGEETPRQDTKSLPRTSISDTSTPSIRVSSATTQQTTNPSIPALAAEKPLPDRPQSITPKKSKLSSLASSRLSSAGSALSVSSRDDGTALTGSVKTFPDLRPSSQSGLSSTPSIQPPSVSPQTSFRNFGASTPSSPRSSATGVSEMTAHVQKAIQAALQLEEIDKTDVQPERPRLTLAQPQSPPPAKGVPLRSLQVASERPKLTLAQPQSPPPAKGVPLRSLQAASEQSARQSPQFPTSQHQRLAPELSAPPSPTPATLGLKPRPPTQMEEVKREEVKSGVSSGKPMSKLAKLAQQKVTANKAPVLPPPKTEYLVPTANGGTATTAITTSYQSFFSLTDPKRPSYTPKLDVVPIATVSAAHPVRTSKIALKVKKAGERPAAKSVVEEPAETAFTPVSPIFQPTTRSRASPSAFASVLVREDLVMYKPSRRSKEKSSNRRNPTEGSHARPASENDGIVPNFVPSSGFAFDSPSPDDLVFNARRGTSLSQSKSGKSPATSTLSSRT